MKNGTPQIFFTVKSACDICGMGFESEALGANDSLEAMRRDGWQVVEYAGGVLASLCPDCQKDKCGRLIAAAPDMLAALERITEQFESTPNPDVVEVAYVAIQRARAAIAKAEGKE